MHLIILKVSKFISIKKESSEEEEDFDKPIVPKPYDDSPY